MEDHAPISPRPLKRSFRFEISYTPLFQGRGCIEKYSAESEEEALRMADILVSVRRKSHPGQILQATLRIFRDKKASPQSDWELIAVHNLIK